MDAVRLRPVAITDLSVRYARDMGDRKVRHYRVSAMQAVAKNLSGEDVTSLISDYIRQNENVDVIFESRTKIIHGGQDAHRGAVLKAEDVSAIVLQRDSSLRKALSKRKPYQLIEEYNYYPSIFHKAYDVFADLFNRFIANPLNKLLMPRFVHGLGHYIDQQLAERFQFKLPVPYMRYKFQRKLNLVRYIAVAFRASQTMEATQALLDDLRLLKRHKLIRGALAMPSVIELADTVGVGERYYVMFCFPLIDDAKLGKMIGEPLDYRSLTLNQLGCKYESHEGGVNWLNGESPEKYYEIETVDISDPTTEEIRKMVIENYEAGVPLVNDIAKRHSDEIKKMNALKNKIDLEANKQAQIAQEANLEKIKKAIEDGEKQDKKNDND